MKRRALLATLCALPGLLFLGLKSRDPDGVVTYGGIERWYMWDAEEGNVIYVYDRGTGLWSTHERCRAI